MKHSFLVACFTVGAQNDVSFFHQKSSLVRLKITERKQYDVWTKGGRKS